MFRLHIYNNDKIKEIEKKATIIKSNSYETFKNNSDKTFLIDFSYEIKRIKVLNNEILYLLYFGCGELKWIEFEDDSWIINEENTYDIVYQIESVDNFNKNIVDDSDLLTELERNYIINQINESKEIDDSWFLRLFIEENLALMENRVLSLNCKLKYLPANIVEKYEQIINNIRGQYQTSFFDYENISF